MIFLTTIFGFILSIWAFFKYFILITVRIDSNTFKNLYDISKNSPKFVLSEDLLTDNPYPNTYQGIIWIYKKVLLYIHQTENKASTIESNTMIYVTCCRWSYKKIRNIISDLLSNKKDVLIQLVTPYYTDKIGLIKHAYDPVFDMNDYLDLETEIKEVASGLRLKTSALLYGSPGNGKTSMIKYFAFKYKLPIKIIILSSDYSNQHIIYQFSQITPKCIVLLEDFDNYFNKRECIIGKTTSGSNTSINFTFDIILNCLDGIYNTYENVVFLMTANDINNIDYALKNRPSRLKFIKEFKNPSYELKYKMIQNWAKININLDQLFRLAEFKEQGLTLQDALSKMNPEYTHNEIAKIAYNRYEERIQHNINGTMDDDWIFALKKLDVII